MKELNCCTTASKCIPVAIWLASETLCSRSLSGKERKTWLAITFFLFLQTRVHLMGPNQVGRCFVTLQILVFLQHDRGLQLGYLRGAQTLLSLGLCWQFFRSPKAAQNCRLRTAPLPQAQQYHLSQIWPVGFTWGTLGLSGLSVNPVPLLVVACLDQFSSSTEIPRCHVCFRSSSQDCFPFLQTICCCVHLLCSWH